MPRSPPWPPASLWTLTSKKTRVCLSACPVFWGISGVVALTQKREVRAEKDWLLAQGTGLTLEERVPRLLRRCSLSSGPPTAALEGRSQGQVEGVEPEGGQPRAGAQGEAVDRLQRGPWGGYLGSACSAPGAAPDRAPATRGRSGPGRAPRWGGGREQGGAYVSRTLLSGCEIQLCLPPGPRVCSGLSPTPLVTLSLSESSLSVTIHHSDSVSLEPGPPSLPSLSSREE